MDVIFIRGRCWFFALGFTKVYMFEHHRSVVGYPSPFTLKKTQNHISPTFETTEFFKILFHVSKFPTIADRPFRHVQQRKIKLNVRPSVHHVVLPQNASRPFQ